MAIEAGAQLANMNSYWGTPVMFDPGNHSWRRARASVRMGAPRAVFDRREPQGQALRQRSASVQRLAEGVRRVRPAGGRVSERRSGTPRLRPDRSRLAANPVD